MTTFPSSSTPTRTGEVCNPPPDLRVMSTARWLLATNARASLGLIRLPCRRAQAVTYGARSIRPGSLTTVRRVRKRPRTIRLLRQAVAAAILQLDLEHPATLDPQRHLTTAEQHHPRCLIASATGIAADLHPVRHAATSRFHLTSQA